ncbi:hypothetical protein [Mesorhizobium sp. M0244]|uniref:hypothetical protein n=1 Tax=Mesorhizobium sp. M0244 TaxID=2956926 RepID=UPI00333C3BFC
MELRLDIEDAIPQAGRAEQIGFGGYAWAHNGVVEILGAIPPQIDEITGGDPVTFQVGWHRFFRIKKLA